MKQADLNKDVKLQPHQISGVHKALMNNGQVLLDWKVGTGKTLGSIAIYEALKKRNKAHTALVLVPAPLRDNYLNEGVKKFTNSSAVIVNSLGSTEREFEKPLGKVPKGRDYYIASNELFRKHPEQLMKETGADTIIMDELHKYKTPATANYKAMMGVRSGVKNVIGMTGTPMTNHPKEIISLLDVVTNKNHHLGTYSDFSRKFLKKTTEIQGPLSSFGIGTKVKKIKPKNVRLLTKEFDKYVHSHQNNTGKMPAKVIHEIDVPMSPEQLHIYNYVLKKNLNPVMLSKIKEDWPVDKNEAKFIFESILQARQASNSLHFFKKGMSLEDSAKRTPKIHRVLDDVENHLKKSPKNKAIIYSNLYQGGVDIVSAGLKSRKIPHGVYVGTTNTPIPERRKAVDDYLTGKKRVIIINQAGTEGLNLPGTTGHFALDGHFNPAVIEQSEARGIRSGSPVDHVDVYRYRSVVPASPVHSWLSSFLPKSLGREHSVDEWVYSTANRKKDLNKAVMNAIEEQKQSVY